MLYGARLRALLVRSPVIYSLFCQTLPVRHRSGRQRAPLGRALQMRSGRDSAARVLREHARSRPMVGARGPCPLTTARPLSSWTLPTFDAMSGRLNYMRQVAQSPMAAHCPIVLNPFSAPRSLSSLPWNAQPSRRSYRFCTR